MNVLSWILTAVVVAQGTASVYLYSELDAERSRANTQAAACRDEQAQRVALQQECLAFAPDATTDEARAESVDQEHPLGASPSGGLDPSTDNSPPGAWVLPAAARGREFSRERHEAALRRMYRGLAQELHLSPEEEADLLSVLLEQRNEQIEAMRKHAGDRAAMTQAMNELRQGNETELMTLLGDKYLEFEDYQKGLGERVQIEQASLQLDAAGIPLRDHQRKELLAVMVEERDRVPRPAWIVGVSPQESITKRQAWQDDYDERVRDRASSLLSSDQLKQYDVYRNLQSAQRRRQLETWRDASRPRPDSSSQNPGAT